LTSFRCPACLESRIRVLGLVNVLDHATYDVIRVEQGLFGKLTHVQALGGIEGPVPFPPHRHQPCQAELRKVLGDPCRVHAQMGRQFVHGVLSVEECPHDPEPGAVCEQLEHVHCQPDLFLARIPMYLRSHADNGTPAPSN